jgi:predicted permease
VNIVGEPVLPVERSRAGIFTVGPRFFETMQIPILAGRDFEERDQPGALVAVVNPEFAKQHGVENPVGRSIILGPLTYQVVGVAGDALWLSLKRDRSPMVYQLPRATPAPPQVTFEVRAAGDPLDHANSVRQIVRQADSRVAVSDLKTQAAHIDQEISREITLARLCTGFAILALVIACVGLYGTTAYNVARRTSEIGIRMALGAQRRMVLWAVLREVIAVGLIGLAIGLPTALGLSRLVESLLYGIKPNDPRALGAAVAILLAAATIAAWLPARKASRIDPTTALRHE